MGSALDSLKKLNGTTSSTTTNSTTNSSSSTSSSTSSSSTTSSSIGTNDSTSIFSSDSYFQRQTTEVEEGLSEDEKYDRLQELMEKRNAIEAANGGNVVHGMSDDEYTELRALLAEYGISTEQEYNYGHFQNVAVAMGESCGNSVRYNAACKAATSMDCLEDLVLMRELQEAVSDIFNGDTDPNWKSLVGNRRLLRDYGIAVIEIADRQYSVAKVDSNGNILQNEDGKLVQYYTSDMLMPDGQAQMNEVHVAEMIDAMGFDCISALDFSTEEYQMIMELGYSNAESSSFSFTDTNAVKDEVLGTYDKATNTWSKAKAQNREDWLNGTYVDKVTGETTGAKKRMSQFNRDLNAGVYRGKGKGSSVNVKSSDYFSASGNGPDMAFSGIIHISSGTGSETFDKDGNVIDQETGEIIKYSNDIAKSDETENEDSNQITNNDTYTTKKQKQLSFNKMVEKYFKKGYSYKKAVSLANYALKTKHMSYKGDNITKEQREAKC